MGTTTAKLTYDDLQEIPPDRNRYELIEGELTVSPSPIPIHQVIVLNLAAALLAHARKNDMGQVFVAPCDIVFGSSTVLEPDVFFISQARLHIIGEKYISGPPDLVVEVLSESTARVDRDTKTRVYAEYGVPECWLIEPQSKTVQIFRLRGSEYEIAEVLGFNGTLASPLLPGFSLPVSSLWS
jgi:Uma2 family endonuclease